MNGRLFDPRLGMFMQGDPFIQDAMNLQNYNRYAYCYNNPMTCTDPTGQFSLFGHKILPGLFNSKTLRIAAAIGAAFVLGPGGAVWGAEYGVLGAVTQNAVAQSAIAGFVSGSIASGTVKGGLQGAVTAGMFTAAGNVIDGGNAFTGGADKTAAWTNPAAGVALHGVVGCVTSEMNGSKCGAGALSAAFSKTMAPSVSEWSGKNAVEGSVVSAVAGGTASVLGGGKFSNGAKTAAFGYLYNACHDGSCSSPWDQLNESPVRKLWDQAVLSFNPPPPDYIAISGGVYTYSGGIVWNLHNDEITWQWSATKTWPGNSFKGISMTATAGYIIGGANAKITQDFLKGGATQVSFFTPTPVGFGLGGAITHSYGGPTAIEIGLGTSGVSYTPVSYGFKKFMRK
jgi:hypothetical protein